MPAKLFFIAIAATVGLFIFPSRAVAQGNPNTPTNPTMVEQQRDVEKEQFYTRFLEHKRIATGEEQRRAYEEAKAYLFRFGGDNDANARAVRKFIRDYEKFLHDYDLTEAYKNKDYTKAFEIGRLALQNDPENFFVLATLTQAAYDSSLTGNSALSSDTIEFARRAIKLLDAGKVTKLSPFANVEVARGFLNHALGWLLKDQSPLEAAEALLKAVRTDSPYQKDPLTYRLLGAAILKGEFTQLSSEYNEKYGNKPPSPEQTAMLEKITRVGDRAIDAYARAVALSTSPQQQDARNKMLAQLTALYRNFHNNSDAGLEELIATVLSKPLP